MGKLEAKKWQRRAEWQLGRLGEPELIANRPSLMPQVDDQDGTEVLIYRKCLFSESVLATNGRDLKKWFVGDSVPSAMCRDFRRMN